MSQSEKCKNRKEKKSEIDDFVLLIKMRLISRVTFGQMWTMPLMIWVKVHSRKIEVTFIKISSNGISSNWISLNRLSSNPVWCRQRSCEILRATYGRGSGSSKLLVSIKPDTNLPMKYLFLVLGLFICSY